MPLFYNYVRVLIGKTEGIDEEEYYAEIERRTTNEKKLPQTQNIDIGFMNK